MIPAPLLLVLLPFFVLITTIGALRRWLHA
mgnify:CR=1 FL=1